MNGPINKGVSSALPPSIRHFENRRGEGPGDEVGHFTLLRVKRARERMGKTWQTCKIPQTTHCAPKGTQKGT